MADKGGRQDGTNAAVAIDRDKNSQHAVRWALDNLSLNNGQLILIHVRIHENLQSKDSEPKEGRAPTQAEMQLFFLPYRGFCARKGIRAKEVILHDLDIACALAQYITNNFITSIVLGGSSRNTLTRAFRNLDVPSCLAKSAPQFCSIYAVSKGGVQNIKSASRPPPSNMALSRRSSETGLSLDFSAPNAPILSNAWDRPPGSTNPSPRYSTECMPKTPSDSQPNSRSISPSQSTNNFTDLIKMIQLERQRGSKDLSPLHSLNNSGEMKLGTPRRRGPGSMDASSLNADPNRDFRPTLLDRQPGQTKHSSCGSMSNLNLQSCAKGNPRNFSSGSSDLSEPTSFRSSDVSFEHLDFTSVSDSSKGSMSSTQTGAEMDDEMKRLKSELKNTFDTYNEACKEVTTAKRQVGHVDAQKLEAACKLQEAMDAHEAALVMIEKERQKCKAAVEAAQVAQRIAELEYEKRKRAEMKFHHEAEEKKKVMNVLARNEINYRRYSIEEIEAATNYFSSSEKIGEGGYGPVYRAYLDHTAVAIKVLRPDMSQGQVQFQRELEVLSCLRHPNMVLLLGACPEYGCLVYEYMEYGSLEDRLFRKNNTPPIPWTVRFEIAAEIATALHFFHQTRPEALVHRDLKPANVLLDKNYKSKISDVGLAKLVPAPTPDGISQYHMTAAVGTFCYIDPEYQQTGMLSPKSDIYSLGIMLLQIITARPPMGLTHHVERSIETGKFADILDPSIDNWPLEEALSFAKLSLKCCELRRKDRPELGSDILPELVRLKDVAHVALNYGSGGGISFATTSTSLSFQGSTPVSEVGYMF